MSTYAIHAGHNADGKIACGAVGYMKESTECRKINEAVIKLLRAEGHKVYDCTVDDARNSSLNLTQIVAKSNEHDVDLVVSIHMNAVKKSAKDGENKGVEVLVYSESSKAKDEAERVCKKLAALGFTNRGVKTRPGLYVLRKTDAPAMLIEVCFCDDQDDYNLYKKLGVNKIAEAIAEGILGKEIKKATTTTTKKTTANTSNSSIKAGKKLTLKNVSLYATATAEKASRKKTGTFYVWSNEVKNGRIKITNSQYNVGKSGQVTGWISKKHAE